MAPMRPVPRTAILTGSPADPLPLLRRLHALVRRGDLAAVGDPGDADLPEGPARRPPLRRRLDRDHARTVGGARPLNGLAELVDGRDALAATAERGRVRGPVDLDAIFSQHVVERAAAHVRLEAVDHRVTAVVADDDDQLLARQHRAVQLGVEHQVRAVAHEGEDFAVTTCEPRAPGAGDLVAHAREAVLAVEGGDALRA